MNLGIAEACILAALASAFGFIAYLILRAIFREVALPIINLFNEDWVFKVRLRIAEKSSYFTYEGSMCMAGHRGFPLARVHYNDGGMSRNMAIGNAVDYASLFGGTVIKPK